jgi:hypothetical protein
LEALNVMGTKEGQIQMVRVGNVAEAHQVFIRYSNS